MPPIESTLVDWALSQPAIENATALTASAAVSCWRARWYLRAKRATDIILGTLLIVLTLPIMAAAAVAIKCTSSGKVLFCQLRAGRNGQPFLMYKFRSMYDGAENGRIHLNDLNECSEGPCFKLRKDPRMTSIGRFLRRSSIDELPQLFNVLKGQMTLVGPRPLPMPEVSTRMWAEQRRLLVKPGLTCLWQISGRTEIPYSEWLMLDLYYIEHRSLMLDLEIMVKTIPAVLSCRGAF